MGSGFITSFESGFTAGTASFGVNAHAFLGLKIDSDKGHSGTWLLPAPKTIIPAVAIPLTPPACCSIVEKSRTCIDRQVMSPLLRIRMPKPESPRIPPFRELGRTPCRQFNQAPNYADCSAIGEVLCITLSARRVLPKRVTSRYRQHRH